MSKIYFATLSVFLLFLFNITSFWNTNSNSLTNVTVTKADSLPNASSWPAELAISHFAGADLTPSPACLAVAPTGEVYVGVDMIVFAMNAAAFKYRMNLQLCGVGES